MASDPCDMKFVIASVRLQMKQLKDEQGKLSDDRDSGGKSDAERSSIFEKMLEIQKNWSELYNGVEHIEECERRIEKWREKGGSVPLCDKQVFNFFKNCSKAELVTRTVHVTGYGSPHGKVMTEPHDVVFTNTVFTLK